MPQLHLYHGLKGTGLRTHRTQRLGQVYLIQHHFKVNRYRLRIINGARYFYRLLQQKTKDWLLPPVRLPQWLADCITKHLFLRANQRLKDQEIELFIRSMFPLLGIEQLLHKQVNRIFRRKRRALIFLLAFLGSPEILLLDEPAVGMDEQHRLLLWRVIREYCLQMRAAAILTTH